MAVPARLRKLTLPKTLIFRSLTSSAATVDDETSIDESAVADKVLSVLSTSFPIEPPLKPLAPLLSPRIVASVVSASSASPSAAFRFFIWASRRRHLRSWDSHNAVLSILRRDGFSIAWTALDELRRDGIPIAAEAFDALIQAYVQSGSVSDAIESFSRMSEYGVRPRTFTYNVVLHVLLKQRMVPLAMAVYRQMLETDCRPNRSTYNVLIDGLCKLGRTDDALSMFDEMCGHGWFDPDTVIYTIVLSGLCRARRIDDARALLATMRCDPDMVTHNAFLNGLCRAGRLDEAMKLVRSERFEFGIRGISTIIDWCFRKGRFNEAMAMYKEVLEEGKFVPDRHLYTIMIKWLSKAGRIEEAFGLLNSMVRKGVVPDTHCYNTLIEGLCQLGLLDKARSLWLEVSRDERFSESKTNPIFICGLCKNGLVGDAQEIFDELERAGCAQTVETFNAIIHGLCKEGNLREAGLLFYKMEMGRSPSLFLRLSQGSDQVLDGKSLSDRIWNLCRSGNVGKAYKLLEELANSGVAPDVTTYNILINGLCKAGRMDGALKFFKELQIKGYSLTRQKVTQAIRIWLDFLSQRDGGSDWETEAIRTARRDFENGSVEELVRGLLDLDCRRHEVRSLPYAIWLIGYCQGGRVKDGLMIFHALTERSIDVTPAGCVILIRDLCKEGMLSSALDVIFYMLKEGILLKRALGNDLIERLWLRNRRKEAWEVVHRISDAGYDMDSYLFMRTKYKLYGDEIESSKDVQS
ncbi:Pentatricopeptide repeat-containing protein [Acorus calamus]|uniref:Pentatricopeptide repeat-containing protein n=1 Tax=Acorus calamus TaxID=4465 RepID=A0AAV9E1E9_ACOCL|nr:Pentatricopeptide repeat-containing protein [Acorus calamus]